MKRYWNLQLELTVIDMGNNRVGTTLAATTGRARTGTLKSVREGASVVRNCPRDSRKSYTTHNLSSTRLYTNTIFKIRYTTPALLGVFGPHIVTLICMLRFSFPSRPHALSQQLAGSFRIQKSNLSGSSALEPALILFLRPVKSEDRQHYVSVDFVLNLKF